jgi:D-amino peptidase
MKVYIICDLEGAAGVADQIHQCSFSHAEFGKDAYIPGIFGPFYLQARRLATLELNAVVEGALEAGATEIWAWDGHCSFPGGLDVELLHPECRLVMNAGDGGPLGLDSTCDALIMVGLHAKEGTPAAPQAHTLFPGMVWNGEVVGEIGMSCATASVHGVKFIMISGDRAAVAEALALAPDIETVGTALRPRSADRRSRAGAVVGAAEGTRPAAPRCPPSRRAHWRDRPAAAAAVHPGVIR